MDRLKGKTLIVAGGGGIGTGVARRLASEGASLVLGDIDLEAAEAVVADIVSEGGTAIATAFDGASETSCNELIRFAISAFGGLDGIHINFANLDDGHGWVDVMQLDLKDFETAMNVNVRGYLLCTRAVIPALIERGGGSIVYTASNSAYLPEEVRVAYGMSKAAILPLMRHVATHFGAQGIRANAIAPGLIMHRNLAALMPEEAQAAFAKVTALRRLGQPKDIAAVSALLLSDDAEFITGQVIGVDGGGFMRP
jgi:NAD(P)-dependent dehydrogenase (short-subunit alcohol dehydrogenase family)